MAGNLKSVKSFASIPGPRSYPLIGTLGSYLLTKKYRFDRLHWNGRNKFDEFGPIVKEEIVPGVNIVWLFDPDDIKTMFANEGSCPARRSHLALEKYRLDRPHLYNNGGLLPTNGSEWSRLRQESQKPLALQSSLAKFNPGINAACDDLIRLMTSSSHCVTSSVHPITSSLHPLTSSLYPMTSSTKSMSSSSEDLVFDDFLEELKRLFMEITGIFTLGTRLGSLDEDQSVVSGKLIKAAFETNANILKTDNSKLWKFFRTKEFKEICRSQNFIEQTAIELIKSSDTADNSLVNLLQSSSHLDSKDILTLVSDMLLAGVDTTSYSMSFLLHLIAKHKDVQDKLRDHVFNDLNFDPASPDVSQNVLKQFSYGKLVLKESLRMFPVSVGVGRVLPVDVVFSGFRVPKGTIVVTQNQVSCRLPQYCPRPNEFLPERWQKGHPDYQGLHPYLSLPFGFGPRMCIGRRVAEQSLLILLLKLIKNFEIELIDSESDLDCVSYLINQPDKPIRLKFRPIKNAK